MTPDDIALQRIFGKSFGAADRSTAADAEAIASAADPTRRTTIQDANANSGWYSPSRSIFGAELDQSLGVRPGSAGLLPVDDDYVDHGDTGAVADDLDPLASIVETEMSDGWTDTVAAYASTHEGFTTDEVLTGAFGMVAEFVDRADQMRVAAILRDIGCTKERVMRDGERVTVWSATPSATPSAD
ncbi:hypothetical protein [Paraburkholderia dipogonis]|uniref:hypothetical protein n=1 Tax=Paraburkholderia dipogonis TaxID=1211383 RepID=UPI0038BA1804